MLATLTCTVESSGVPPSERDLPFLAFICNHNSYSETSGHVRDQPLVLYTENGPLLEIRIMMFL